MNTSNIYTVEPLKLQEDGSLRDAFGSSFRPVAMSYTTSALSIPNRSLSEPVSHKDEKKGPQFV